MAFPATPLDLRVELNLSGWTDISTYTLQRDGTQPLTSITRGRPNEQASAVPTAVSAQWNNRDGRFSPRNPTGPYYGLLGRNTPLRLSVPGTTALRIADDATSYASCPGAAGLNLTADIDVRLDMDLDNWAPCFLAGQFASGVTISWALSLNGDGSLLWTWLPVGSGSTSSVSSTMPVPLGRGAVRAYFDPAATSGAAQVIFYTAASMGAAWTQLGNAVPVPAGVYATAYGGTALYVGYNAQWSLSPGGYVPGQPGLQGRVYEFRVYNATTLAADPVFSAQTAGATSFSDAQSNTWTLSGSASIDNRSYRAHAECTTLPQRWDSTGTDVWTPVAAKGILQRLQQGSSPLPSPMRRAIAAMTASQYYQQAYSGTTLAYWPCEDAQGATQIASGLPAGLPMSFSGTPAFQGVIGSKTADSQFTCSAQLAQVQSSTWSAAIPYTALAGSTANSDALSFLLAIPSGGAPNNAVLMSVALTGHTLALVYSTSNSGSLYLTYDGVQLGAGFVALGINGLPLWCQMQTATSGGALATLAVLTPAAATAFNSYSVSLSSPAMRSLTVNPAGAALGATEIGHIWAAADASGPAFYGNAIYPSVLGAWAGESAATRFLRLCSENGIAGRVYGYPALTPKMAAQPIDTLANLFQYTEVTDRGQVYEPAEALGLGYRTLGSLSSQAAALTLDYSQAQLGDGGSAGGLEPEDDDQYTTNDVTVQRNNGSSAQVQVTSGPMSIQAPPNGVGDYNTQVTTYNAWDKDLTNIASWIAWAGTCSEERYPVIPLNLARTQLASLTNTIAGMRLGGYFQIINMLSQMPPGAVKQLLYGYTELLGGFHWRIAFNGVPETPYEVAAAGTARAASAGSQLASGVSSSATSLSVTTTAGQLWTTAGGDFPFGILIAGELMTVTNITGSSSPQTFTVTRAVNGVFKAQLANAAVTLANTPVAALAGNH